uniref:Protein kinase c conserved region 2 n=1 Tax=Rhodnius neglectus TaxID=72488 RepID=A0A0P4VNK8_9HEMI
MWSPTHVQVTVQRARDLISKGKNGTNNVFVTIGLGKEKFQTSVKDKATNIVEWREKCELLIPKQGNKAEIVLIVLHHNVLGVDEFLGRVHIPLNEMDVYERPKNRWFKLKDKIGKEKNKERGELEVKVAFIVKAGSLSDLSKKEKHKSSLGQLSHAAQSFGGSLISIGSLDKRKGLKKLATKIGNKLNKKSQKPNDEIAGDEFKTNLHKQCAGDADPGVISEAESDDDFMLDELSHKGSGCSLSGGSSSRRSVDLPDSPRPIEQRPAKPPRVPSLIGHAITHSTSDDFMTTESFALKGPRDNDRFLERIIIGKEVTRTSSPSFGLATDAIKQYSDKSKEDLIFIIMELQDRLSKEQKRQRELEDYLDQLLLRVMETSPRILQNPYSKAGVA